MILQAVSFASPLTFKTPKYSTSLIAINDTWKNVLRAEQAGKIIGCTVFWVITPRERGRGTGYSLYTGDVRPWSFFCFFFWIFVFVFVFVFCSSVGEGCYFQPQQPAKGCVLIKRKTSQWNSGKGCNFTVVSGRGGRVRICHPAWAEPPYPLYSQEPPRSVTRISKVSFGYCTLFLFKEKGDSRGSPSLREKSAVTTTGKRLHCDQKRVQRDSALRRPPDYRSHIWLLLNNL